jgi:uncharacterized protein (TIGR02391 family)
VEIRLRELSGLDLSGRDLAAQALGGDAPRVLIGRHPGRTGSDEQEGMRFMFMGAAQGLRNPGGHELDSLERHEALEELAVASLLLRWLDTSRTGDIEIAGDRRRERRTRTQGPGGGDSTPAIPAQTPARLVVLRELQDIAHRQARTNNVLDLELGQLAERSGAAVDKLQDALVDLLAEGLAEAFADSQGHSADHGACQITGNGIRELGRLEDQHSAST